MNSTFLLNVCHEIFGSLSLTVPSAIIEGANKLRAKDDPILTIVRGLYPGICIEPDHISEAGK